DWSRLGDRLGLGITTAVLVVVRISSIFVNGFLELLTFLDFDSVDSNGVEEPELGTSCATF
ncbi:20773_t:CDS:2, partial [Gigaspora rosea]